MKFGEFIRKAFSENNVPSAKRVVGGLMIVVVLFCTVWSCIKYGMDEHVTSVIETEIITAGALLGGLERNLDMEGEEQEARHGGRARRPRRGVGPKGKRR